MEISEEMLKAIIESGITGDQIHDFFQNIHDKIFYIFSGEVFVLLTIEFNDDQTTFLSIKIFGTFVSMMDWIKEFDKSDRPIFTYVATKDTMYMLQGKDVNTVMKCPAFFYNLKYADENGKLIDKEFEGLYQSLRNSNYKIKIELM
jgi:hypothetical protein